MLLHDFFLCVFFTNIDFTDSIQIKISLVSSVNHISCLQIRIVKLLQVILSIIFCRKIILSYDLFFFINISFTDSIQIKINLDFINLYNAFLYFRSFWDVFLAHSKLDVSNSREITDSEVSICTILSCSEHFCSASNTFWDTASRSWWVKIDCCVNFLTYNDNADWLINITDVIMMNILSSWLNIYIWLHAFWENSNMFAIT